jgi:hypothetical protein
MVNAIGSVRLISKKTRVVELFGPEPLGSRRPTDRELLLDRPQASFLDFVRDRSVLAHAS